MKPETAISTDNVSRNEILPANEDDVFAASQVPAVDKKDKNKNKNKKNKDKNKNKKEDSINSAKFEHIANIAPAIEKNEVPDIILESPAPIDFDNQETQNADIESKNIIDDFGIKPSDNVADTEPNQDLSADDTPIDESIDIDLDEFFAAANGDDDDLPHTLPQPAADSVKSVDIEHTAPEAEVLPTSDETSFDEYTIDQPTDDLDAAFDLGSEQAEPEPVSEPASDLGFEFEVEDENDDTAFDIADETEAEPDIITEPEPEPEPEPDPEPEYETEDQAAPRPSVSYNSDYDSAMLKIKEALNSKDEVSLDDMDITPVSLSSDNSFSSLTNEEEDDLAQSPNYRMIRRLSRKKKIPMRKNGSMLMKTAIRLSLPMMMNGNMLMKTATRLIRQMMKNGNMLTKTAIRSIRQMMMSGNMLMKTATPLCRKFLSKDYSKIFTNVYS